MGLRGVTTYLSIRFGDFWQDGTERFHKLQEFDWKKQFNRIIIETSIISFDDTLYSLHKILQEVKSEQASMSS